MNNENKNTNSSEFKHTKDDLARLMSMSLNEKVGVTQARTMEWYVHYNKKCYVSFSGGKDSTVLAYIAAQGLLLDQNNTEYFPHLTPSNTGIENPKRIIENVEWNDEINIETCYVSRTYLTRHGAGKFPSECNKRFINEYMFDKTNVPNPFQDTLRYGTLDLRELYSRCSDDVENFGDEKSIAITHCNEYDWDNDKLIKLFKDWNIYYSDGETHNDVN